MAPEGGPEIVTEGITIEPAGGTLRVSTGAVTIDVSRRGPSFLAAAEVAGSALLESTAIVAEDRHGTRYRFQIQRTSIERAAALRAVIRVDGQFVDAAGHSLLDATLRLHFFAGLGTVSADLSITNPRAARHPGGRWDLGDAGSVLIRDLSIAIVPVEYDRAEVWGSLDASDAMGPAGGRFVVRQESSGGPEWQHINHVTRDNVVAARFRGFRATRGEREVTDFSFGGEVVPRPKQKPSERELNTYNYFRRNVAGVQREWWYHRSGCREWFQAERDTTTNEVKRVGLPGTLA